MTAEELAAVAGVVISLGFSFIPGLRELYDKQNDEMKRLVMLGALVVVAAGTFGLSCAGLLTVVVCTTAGAWEMVKLLVIAAIANQTTWKFTPKVRARRARLKSGL